VSKTGEYPCGGGGFSALWHGSFDGTKVTIKVLRIYVTRKADRESKVNKDVCREIFIWLRLIHDTILPLLGFCFSFSPTTSLISPWMSNGSAKDFLQENHHFPPVNLVVQIAEALDYLHSGQAGMAYIHGNVKGVSSSRAH
ncbi:hypothetical protein JAAARDRAFT_89283, partial [Jaapia argillacea MUCL 33604]